MFSGSGPDGTWYEVYGDLKRTPIVLCHGVGLDLHMWDDQIPVFVRDFSVIRYDLIGHGRTPVRSNSSSISAFTEQLLTLVTHLNLESIILVGLILFKGIVLFPLMLIYLSWSIIQWMLDNDRLNNESHVKSHYED